LAFGEGADTIDNFEHAVGSDFDDVLRGTDVHGNTLVGNAGDDLLQGRDGDDTLIGGAGEDTLEGGDDNDSLDGGSFMDTLRGGLGDDTIDGGSNFDTVDYSMSATGVIIDLFASGLINLAGSPVSGALGEGFDRLFNIEHATGSEQADVIIGTAVHGNILQGLGGDDILFGLAGDDTLDGGADSDTAAFGFSSVGVTVDLGAGTATGEGSDTLISIEVVSGSDFDDRLTGANGANDLLEGGVGNDTLAGRSGDDTLSGGAGDDLLLADSGTDS
ncbi:calcium-binding protein, partial [Cognatishimia sp. F0-27]|uniref:calcium-binding protein n=1 Tax=Cognatishimia sp. F0-27 TaxID=2816855 RepID=UPI001D47E598